MSDNNVQEAVLTPEDAMLTHRDTPQQQESRGQLAHQIRQRITLGPRKQKFSSRSTYKIEWQEYGQWRELELPIQSLSADINQRILDRHSMEDVEIPDIPRVVETYTDAEGNQRQVSTQDNTSPEWIIWSEIINRWMTAVNYEKLLYALDVDLESEEGEIVWSSVDQHKYDVESGLKALKALEIPESQLSEIVRTINNLSVRTAQEDASNFLSESEQPSASQDTSTTDGANPRQRRRGQRR